MNEKMTTATVQNNITIHYQQLMNCPEEVKAQYAYEGGYLMPKKGMVYWFVATYRDDSIVYSAHHDLDSLVFHRDQMQRINAI